MTDMKILMVASEAEPFARTGGLGDVMGALPPALARLGHEVKVILPRYGFIDGEKHGLKALDWSVDVPHYGETAHASIEMVARIRHLARYYFIDNPHFFDRPELYYNPETGKDYTDNDERFAFFSRTALEIVRKLNWKPDIIHVHDWQTALIPVYLKTVYSGDSFFNSVTSVLTIHNLGYQGLFDGDRTVRLGLPPEMFHALIGPLEFYGKTNFLKAGINMADKITTVSVRYAEEIQSSKEFGYGLQDVLSERADDLHGIPNGVNYDVWAPSRDKLIPHRYNINNLSGKRITRVELMNIAGLPIRERTPLIGMITRLAAQKGLDLVTEAAEELFKLNMQMVILGTGDELFHRALKKLEDRYPDQLKVFLEFNDRLAHMIQAGADMFLMPSRYEPCGLNQMYSLKYGTVPVVRAVGGLADTVSDYDTDSQGTGFVFEEYCPKALITALSRAVRLFDQRRQWTKLMKNGMVVDYSWDRSAEKYGKLFGSISRSSQPSGSYT